MNVKRLQSILSEYHSVEVLVSNSDGKLNRKIIHIKPTPDLCNLIIFTDRRIGVGDRRKLEAEND